VRDLVIRVSAEIAAAMVLNDTEMQSEIPHSSSSSASIVAAFTSGAAAGWAALTTPSFWFDSSEDGAKTLLLFDPSGPIIPLSRPGRDAL
jgi:hypothetical protein